MSDRRARRGMKMRLALAPALLLIGCSGGDVTGNGSAGRAAAPTNSAAPAAPTMRTRPEAEQLDTAFRAVFNRASPAPRNIDGQRGSERARRVIWTDFGPILLTESAMPDGCHACAGYVGAYYLRDTGGGFEVASRYPEAVTGAGWGSAPSWRVVENFTTHPAIYAEGGYTGQGYTQSWATITELRPQGPIESRVDLGSDNGGAVADESEAVSLAGHITNVVRNSAFDVIYTGSCRVTRHYVFRAGRFQPATGGAEDAVACPGRDTR
jgi:hypothetical protein